METAPKNTKAQAEDFFFSGGTEYIPTTITATSREEAEKEWTKVRIPVASAEKTPNTPPTAKPISKSA